jgi:hypothetical protein
MLLLWSGGAGTENPVFFLDDFTGTIGTALTAHTPDVGTSWTNVVAGEDMILTGDGYARADDANSGSSWYLANPAPPGLLCQVTLQVLAKSTGQFFGATSQHRTGEEFFAAGSMWWITFQLSGSTSMRDSQNATRGTGAATFNYSANDVFYVRLKYDGKVKFQISTDGTNYTDYRVEPRNDVKALVNAAWTLGPTGIYMNGAATASTGSWINQIECRTIEPDSSLTVLATCGTSIARGFGCTDPYTDCFTQIWLNTKGAGFAVSNMGIDSQNTPQMTSYDPAKLTAYLDSRYTKRYVVFFDGGNDMSAIGLNLSGAAAYANTQAWLAAVKAIFGSTVKYVIFPCLPRDPAGVSGANYITRRNAYNVLVTANAIADGFDVIVNPDVTYFADAAALDIAKYPDGVHPVTAMHALMGADLVTATNSV